MNQSTQEIVLIENTRLSYAYLFEPYRGKNDAGKETASYGAHALLPPDHPALAVIRAAQRRVAVAAWGAEAENVLTQLAAQDRLCLHNGDVSKAGQESYKGMFYVSANGKVQPQIVVTRNGVNVAIAKNDPSAPYSGCWANMFIAIYAQGPNGKPSQYGKRINAQLTGVQFLRHDTAFGGGGKVARPDEFPTVKGADADGAAPAATSAASAGLF
jgi:hypothetical protein